MSARIDLGCRLTRHAQLLADDRFQRRQGALGEGRARVEEDDHGKRDELVLPRDEPPRGPLFAVGDVELILQRRDFAVFFRIDQRCMTELRKWGGLNCVFLVQRALIPSPSAHD